MSVHRHFAAWGGVFQNVLPIHGLGLPLIAGWAADINRTRCSR